VKSAGVIAFSAAAACHALLLFGFRTGSVARPLPLGDTPQTVDVALVAAPAESSAPESMANPAPTPEPTPEPPAPVVQSEVQSEPPAPAEMPVPEPEPQPALAQPTPASTPPPKPVAAAKRSENKKQTHETAPQKESAASTAPRRSLLSQWAQCLNSVGGAKSRGSVVRYHSNPPPPYPGEAKRKKQEGKVLVSVQVETNGRPNSVTLISSSGFPLLDAAALEAVRKWTFYPQNIGGLPVASRVEVPVVFTLKDR